jgi:3-oxoacyl-[acyl-carrier-protein] synthase-3
MIRTAILGLGSYVPDRIVTNEEIPYLDDKHVRQPTKQTETSDAWIQQRTGIRERRYVPNDGSVATSDLALAATRRALADANLEPSEIDCIIFGTLSPDFHFPGTGVVLQKKLGIDRTACACFDIRQQCSAFIYGLQMADAFIRTGMYRRVLLVGAELHSHALDFTNRGRDVTVLFGDGAGAVVVSPTTEDRGIRGWYLGADGRYADVLAQKVWDMSKRPYVPTRPEDGVGEVQPEMLWANMDGKLVFKNAVERMIQVFMQACWDQKIDANDIELFLFNQANLRINQMVAQMLNIPEHKTVHNIQRYGNTTAATIPLLMAEAVETGRLKPGMKVACVAFGSGFTWGSAIIDW